MLRPRTRCFQGSASLSGVLSISNLLIHQPEDTDVRFLFPRQVLGFTPIASSHLLLASRCVWAHVGEMLIFYLAAVFCVAMAAPKTRTHDTGLLCITDCTAQLSFGISRKLYFWHSTPCLSWC